MDGFLAGGFAPLPLGFPPQLQGAVPKVHGLPPPVAAGSLMQPEPLARWPTGLPSVRLHNADCQQQQLLSVLRCHRQQQATFMQAQAAAAAGRAAMDMPQMLQQGAFERCWQLLDAQWQQARAEEQETWRRMREEQVGVTGGAMT